MAKRARTAALGSPVSFAFVRNPWDRAVSLYSFRVDRGDNRRDGEVIPFGEWVEETFGHERQSPANIWNGPQIDWLSDENGHLLIDFVGRFESLSEDFAHICEVIGREDASLPHLKTSSRSAYPGYYDDRTRQIVADWFAPDIEAFGYTFADQGDRTGNGKTLGTRPN